MEFFICFDNTPEAYRALELAHQHAKVWNADLRVVQAIRRKETIDHKRIAEIEELQLEQVRKHLKTRSFKSILLTDDLEPGEQIVDLAKRLKPDQIFIGIQRKSKVGKLLFGSTAQVVILNSPCPVISVT
jgi:nucleotide-binding universal stress UspA family protein